MERVLEKVIGDAISGSRRAQTLADDLETMFEMWTGYMFSRLGEKKFKAGLQTFEDESFNLDGYEPTIMPVPLQMMPGMSSIGVDMINPTIALYDPGLDTMLLAEASTMNWLLFTITEQGHPLKGLRYVTGFREGEVCVPMDDPLFTETYNEEQILIGGLGCFIDKRERLLRTARPEIFE